MQTVHLWVRGGSKKNGQIFYFWQLKEWSIKMKVPVMAMITINQRIDKFWRFVMHQKTEKTEYQVWVLFLHDTTEGFVRLSSPWLRHPLLASLPRPDSAWGMMYHPQDTLREDIELTRGRSCQAIASIPGKGMPTVRTENIDLKYYRKKQLKWIRRRGWCLLFIRNVYIINKFYDWLIEDL